MKRLLDKLFLKIEQNRRTCFLLLIGFIVIIFQEPLEKTVNTLFVEPLFSKVSRENINDFIFSIIAVLAILYYLKNWLNDKVFNKNSWIIYGLVAFGYIYYRFFSATWILINFKTVTFIKYSDIWLFLPFLFLKYHKRNNIKLDSKENLIAFISDDFDTFKKKDWLQREHLGKKFAERINKSVLNKSFAIGIVGNWGSGKTVFLSFIEKHLESNIAIINFNPWLSQTSNQIISDFFLLLRKEIGKYTDELDDKFITYIDHLVTIEKNIITQLISTSKSLLFGEKSTEELYESINNTLQKLNKKIVVFIDDLDRLDKEEVFEVLRLIRNTGNFCNVYYIVAYDRDYVINSLKKISEHNIEYYLEKIFQYEFKLPNFDYNLIKTPFFEILKQVTAQQYHAELKEIIFGGGTSLGAGYLEGFIENMRDVARFPNTFGVDMDLIGEEVLIKEFFYIEMVKFKYPSLYNLLYTRKNEFFIQTYNFNANLIELTKHKNGESLLENYIHNNYKSLSIPLSKVDFLIEHTVRLFHGSLINSSISHLSIRNYNRFHVYFTNSLFIGDLSEGEFKEYRRKSYSELEFKVKEWIKEGKIYKLQKKLEEVKTYDDAQDFKQIIKIIFFILRFQDYDNGFNASYNYQDLINKLSNWDDQISKKYFNSNKEEYKEFIKTLISEGKYPFLPESDFIRFLFETEQVKNFIISPEDLKEIQSQFFINFIDAHKPTYSDYNIYRIFWQNIKSGNKQVTSIFKDYIKESFLKYFLKHSIKNNRHDIFPDRNSTPYKYSIVEELIIEIFKSYEQFKEFLEEQHEDEFLKEFKDFFVKWKSNDCKSVEYEFKVIPVEKNLIEDN